MIERLDLDFVLGLGVKLDNGHAVAAALQRGGPKLCDRLDFQLVLVEVGNEKWRVKIVVHNLFDRQPLVNLGHSQIDHLGHEGDQCDVRLERPRYLPVLGEDLELLN